MQGTSKKVDEHESESEADEQAPNFLTADELQAREPVQREPAREKPERPSAKPAPQQGT